MILDHFHDCSLAGKERDQHTGHSRRRGKIGWLRNFRRFGIILLAPKLVGFPPLIMLPLSTVFSILRSIYMLSFTGGVRTWILASVALFTCLL